MRRMIENRGTKSWLTFDAEKLEQRWLLAGNVNVSVRNGDLVILGDNLANEVEVVATEVAGQFSVTGLGTSINDAFDPVVVDGVVDDLVVNLRRGANRLTLDGGDNALDSARIKLGRDGDTVELTRLELAGNLTVVASGGDDEVLLDRVRSLRRIRVSGGGGDDHIGLYTTGAETLMSPLGGGEDWLEVAQSTSERASFAGGGQRDLIGDDGTNAFDNERVRSIEDRTDEASMYFGPTYDLHTNSLDATLLVANYRNGTSIKYLGQKDSNGLATALDTFEITDASGLETSVQIDDEGRPRRFDNPEVGTLDLLWLSETEVAVSFLSVDGDIQANVVIDLTDPGVPTSTSTVDADIRATRPPTDLAPSDARHDVAADNWSSIDVSAASLGFGNELAVNSPVGATEPSDLAGTSSSIVTVTQCDGVAVEDAIVKMVATGDGQTITLQGRHLGGGQYQVDIPTTDSNPGETAEDICEGVLDFLTLCPIVEAIPPGGEVQICVGLGAAIDLALGGPTGEGAAIAAVCVAGIRGYQLACKINPGPNIPGAPGLLDAVCANIKDIVNYAIGEDYLLTPVVQAPGLGTMVGNTESVSALGPFPDFSVDFGGDLAITSFTVAPPDPAPFQSYVATVQIACAPPDTLVTMSISGTDGYTDSITCLVSGTGSCELSVPGAVDGIRDVITVTIDGGPSRTIAIVF